MKNSGNGGLVYSTDAGRMCPACRRPVAACTCKAGSGAVVAGAVITNDGIARVSRQTKGRGGKAVTLVKGLPPWASNCARPAAPAAPSRMG